MLMVNGNIAGTAARYRVSTYARPAGSCLFIARLLYTVLTGLTSGPEGQRSAGHALEGRSADREGRGD